MKYNRVIKMLFLAVSLLLLAATISTPSYAEEGIALTLDLEEGEIGEKIHIDGHGFSENSQLYIYFSSNELDVGDHTENEITAYEGVGIVDINDRGEFVSPKAFKIPEVLNDGEDHIDVLSGNYHFYAVYRRAEYVIAKAEYNVVSGEIEVQPEEGNPGNGVSITGDGMRPNQQITVKFDTSKLDIISGDTVTDTNGGFHCTVIIPESTAGEHTLTAIDESGNEPDAEFTVEPVITLDTLKQTIDGTVDIEGRGFAYRSDIDVTLDNDPIITSPVSLHSNHDGNFSCSIEVPYYSEYYSGEPSIVTARDEKSNAAEAELVILDIPAAISVDPVTSPVSPGYVGMQLEVTGTHFLPGNTVIATFDGNGNPVTTTVDNNSRFSLDLTVPPSIAGNHTIETTDGENIASSLFVMESRPPQIPVPLEPAATDYVDPQARFDWQDVTDPSGVSYHLQISSDSEFNNIVVEKSDLAESDYTLSSEEELEPGGQGSPYYWRVRAIDGAFNESDWSAPRSFYVDSRSVIFSGETSYIWIAVVAVVGFLIYRTQKNKSS